MKPLFTIFIVSMLFVCPSAFGYGLKFEGNKRPIAERTSYDVFGSRRVAFNSGLDMAAVFLEPAVGSRRFATAYLLSGLVAGICSARFHVPPVAGVGASGAVFGICGFAAALMITGRLRRSPASSMWGGMALYLFFISEGW